MERHAVALPSAQPPVVGAIGRSALRRRTQEEERNQGRKNSTAALRFTVGGSVRQGAASTDGNIMRHEMRSPLSTMIEKLACAA